MISDDSRHELAGCADGQFTTTHWSVVLAARRGDSPQAAEALETLCRAYWYPLYAFVRRQGQTPEDAQDLTQSFFAHLLRKDFLSRVGPEKGRFRSFLLACLKHFLADEWEKARTAKRGGAGPEFLLDLGRAEERYQLEARVEANAESLYERRWALDLLDRVLDRLRREAVASDKIAVFDQLQGCLLGERPNETYAQLGAKLGLSETAVKVTVYRLRQRYRELLREEIAETVARPEEVDGEMRFLFEVVSR
ncbi:MAG: sigma-70 family RNA polymerase sigma factor [Chloroflexi bacterium]|nr:sigma-70 family RNA polymerase sigma factor [Chloroflexota bacterium]